MRLEPTNFFSKLYQSVKQEIQPFLPQPKKAEAAPATDRLDLSSAAKQPKLSGSFLQLSGADNEKPLEFWLNELGAMKKVGMDTAVIQFNQYNGANFSEATEKILTAADKLGMKVMVGTALNEQNWYTNQLSDKFLKAEGKSVADYTRVLVKQFSPHESFQGVYIPYETNLTANAASIGDFYGQITQAVKEENPKAKVMISPFTNLIPGLPLSLPEGVIANNFKEMLKRSKVDILAWQDGVGGTKDQLNRIDHDLSSISQACQEQGVELWADVEGFERTTKFYEGFSAKPASMNTLKDQMEREAPYVSKIISFDFNHYMSPQAGDSAAALYHEYEEYLKGQ